VSVPALPGCHAQGETREEALAMIREAIEGCIESLVAHGDPIPGPVEIERVTVNAPDRPSKVTSIEEVRERIGTRAMTPDESEKFWREHGPLMQPSDGER
jgi:predicted RNase H-like HicB family nuclease